MALHPSWAAVRTALMTALGAVLLALWLYTVDLSALAGEVSTVNIYYFIAIGALLTLSNLFRALRWKVFLDVLHVVKYRTLLELFCFSNMVNFISPVRAGEVVKLAYLKKLFGVRVSHSLSALTIDRLLTFYWMFAVLLTIPVASFSMHRYIENAALVALIMLMAGTVFILFAFTRKEQTIGALLWLCRRLGRYDTCVDIVNNYIEGINRIVNLRIIIKGSIITLLMIAVETVRTYLCFKAVGLDVSLMVCAVGYCTMGVLFFVPTPPAQVGSLEWLYSIVFFFGFKLSEVDVAGAAVVNHLVLAVVMAALGFLGFMGLRFSSEEV